MLQNFIVDSTTIKDTDFAERTKLPGWLWLSRRRKEPSSCDERMEIARRLEIRPW